MGYFFSSFALESADAPLSPHVHPPIYKWEHTDVLCSSLPGSALTLSFWIKTTHPGAPRHRRIYRTKLRYSCAVSSKSPPLFYTLVRYLLTSFRILNTYHSKCYLEVFRVSIAPSARIFSFLLILLREIMYPSLTKSSGYNFFFLNNIFFKSSNLGVLQKIPFFKVRVPTSYFLVEAL